MTGYVCSAVVIGRLHELWADWREVEGREGAETWSGENASANCPTTCVASGGDVPLDGVQTFRTTLLFCLGSDISRPIGGDGSYLV